MSKKTFDERFWAKVDRSAGPNGCWLWTASGADGYGRIRLSHSQRLVLAHRASYEMVHGKIPAGLLVCHTCDCRKCVNPAHLFAGTQNDNMRDASQKGHIFLRKQHGELNALHKLTEPKVIEIRQRWAAGNITQRELAGAFRVSRGAINNIVNGYTWTHL